MGLAHINTSILQKYAFFVQKICSQRRYFAKNDCDCRSLDRSYSFLRPIQATPLFLWCRKILQIPTRYNVANWRFYVETERIWDHFAGFGGMRCKHCCCPSNTIKV